MGEEMQANTHARQGRQRTRQDVVFCADDTRSSEQSKRQHGGR